jgi:hypothetical protein
MISSPTIRTHTAVSIPYYFLPITDAPIKNAEIWFTLHKRKTPDTIKIYWGFGEIFLDKWGKVLYNAITTK